MVAGFHNVHNKEGRSLMMMMMKTMVMIGDNGHYEDSGGDHDGSSGEDKTIVKIKTRTSTMIKIKKTWLYARHCESAEAHTEELSG